METYVRKLKFSFAAPDYLQRVDRDRLCLANGYVCKVNDVSPEFAEAADILLNNWVDADCSTTERQFYNAHQKLATLVTRLAQVGFP